jgi:hypothetical protein
MKDEVCVVDPQVPASACRRYEPESPTSAFLNAPDAPASAFPTTPTRPRVHSLRARRARECIPECPRRARECIPHKPEAPASVLQSQRGFWKTTSPKAGARALHLAIEIFACAASHYLCCSSACRPDNRNFALALCPCQNWCCACRPDNRQIRKNSRISCAAKMLRHVGRIIGATRKNAAFHELSRCYSMSAGQSAQPEKMPDLLVLHHVAACQPENRYNLANRYGLRPDRHSLLDLRAGHCSNSWLTG